MIRLLDVCYDYSMYETWCILGDGSGIAVMPSVPILVVCITNLYYVRYIYVLDCYGPLRDPFILCFVIGCVEYPGWGYS